VLVPGCGGGGAKHDVVPLAKTSQKPVGELITLRNTISEEFAARKNILNCQARRVW
jgi:hypothetical protein